MIVVKKRRDANNIRCVCFLDIDGVLNVIPQGRDEFGSLFHPHLVSNLDRIVSVTGAKIVITSTWRYSGLKAMQDMWVKRGLPGEVIGITPVHSSKYDEPNYVNLPFHERLERGFEIQEWLDVHRVNNYVILDDDDDMLESQMQNFVNCSGNFDDSDYVDYGYGLTRECADRAIRILINGGALEHKNTNTFSLKDRSNECKRSKGDCRRGK